jgi:general secretion pathway protein L
MSEFLFIRPTLSEPRSYLWFSYDDVSHNILASGTEDSLLSLVEINKNSPNRPVVVLYPATSLKFKNINYPGKLKKNSYNSILYMLEEDFAEDIELFAVNILNRQGKNYDVLIYKTDELRDFEEALIALKFDVDIIVPDVLALPMPTKLDNQLSIYTLNIGNEWIFRDSNYSGFSTDNDWLSLVNEQLSADKHMISLSNVPEEYRNEWDEQLTDSPLALLADGALKGKVNLSTTHQKKNYQLQFMQSWIKVGVLFICIVIFWHLNMQYKIKSVVQETMSYRNEQRSIFSQIMPENGRTNDPVATLKQRLSESSPIGTDEGYIDLLNMISPIILTNKDIEMVSLKFERRKKSFIIQFLAPEDFDMEKFKNSFGVDFNVTTLDAKQSRDKILNSVQLRRMK